MSKKPYRGVTRAGLMATINNQNEYIRQLESQIGKTSIQHNRYIEFQINKLGSFGGVDPDKMYPGYVVIDMIKRATSLHSQMSIYIGKITSDLQNAVLDVYGTLDIIITIGTHYASQPSPKMLKDIQDKFNSNVTTVFNTIESIITEFGDLPFQFDTSDDSGLRDIENRISQLAAITNDACKAAIGASDGGYGLRELAVLSNKLKELINNDVLRTDTMLLDSKMNRGAIYVAFACLVLEGNGITKIETQWGYVWDDLNGRVNTLCGDEIDGHEYLRAKKIGMGKHEKRILNQEISRLKKTILEKLYGNSPKVS